MNYYIIPKNYFTIKINIQLTSDKVSPIISDSLLFYMKQNYKQLLALQENNNEDNSTLEDIFKIIHPYEFINTNVPGTNISVSKVKAKANIFFELMELFQLFNINDILSLKHKINVAHLTPNYTSSNYLLNMLREENDDNIISKDFNYAKLVDFFIHPHNNKAIEFKLDLIIVEFNTDDYKDIKKYTANMLLILLIIIKYQMNEGLCVIKLDIILYKPIIDIIFILSGIYEKVYLIKPSISNITKGERYLICKGFNEKIQHKNKLLLELEEKCMSKNVDNKYIYSILDNELPYYLLNKLEESNLIIGQQQLEAYDHIIHIFKNKIREEKMENLKRTHIQKCIHWCEKNQLPHNKFIDKINIFLSTSTTFDLNGTVN